MSDFDIACALECDEFALLQLRRLYTHGGTLKRSRFVQKRRRIIRCALNRFFTNRKTAIHAAIGEAWR